MWHLSYMNKLRWEWSNRVMATRPHFKQEECWSWDALYSWTASYPLFPEGQKTNIHKYRLHFYYIDGVTRPKAHYRKIILSGEITTDWCGTHNLWSLSTILCFPACIFFRNLFNNNNTTRLSLIYNMKRNRRYFLGSNFLRCR